MISEKKEVGDRSPGNTYFRLFETGREKTKKPTRVMKVAERRDD